MQLFNTNVEGYSNFIIFILTVTMSHQPSASETKRSSASKAPKIISIFLLIKEKVRSLLLDKEKSFKQIW